ncbi:MAG: hypothetical protein QM793_12515 [Muricomes sp.]
MRRKMYMLGILFLVMIIGGGVYLLYQGVKGAPDNPYKDLQTTSVNKFLEEQDDYYVYAQRAGCPYCDNVRDEIIEFARNNQLYVLDTRAEGNEGIKDYNWDEHHKAYDKEIGKVVKGKMILQDGLTEANLKERYSPLDYSIKKADKEFVELNAGKEEGKIYAVRESPIIDYTNVSDENLVIAAVPTLFHIKNGQIESYYFGDIQILNFLGVDKAPLDKYIN